MVPRLLEKYRSEVIPRMMKNFNYKNVMQVPRIDMNDLAMITGQRPVLKRAKKSVAGFKLRKDMPVACCVTLRGPRMWEFLDRLISLALPRIKDFQGVSRKGLDGRGNYNLGLKEQLIFPEIDYDDILRIRGMNVSITTTANTDEEAYGLLKELGMPFRQ